MVILHKSDLYYNMCSANVFDCKCLNFLFIFLVNMCFRKNVVRYLNKRDHNYCR